LQFLTELVDVVHWSHGILCQPTSKFQTILLVQIDQTKLAVDPVNAVLKMADNLSYVCEVFDLFL
jgi:hypothetical protein